MKEDKPQIIHPIYIENIQWFMTVLKQHSELNIEHSCFSNSPHSSRVVFYR